MNKNIAHKVTEIINDIELDFQLIATEMDTSVADMLYLSKSICFGTEISAEIFEKLIKDIKVDNGVEITSFDENTALYEYFNEAVIINTVFGEDTLFFDSMVCDMIFTRIEELNTN